MAKLEVTLMADISEVESLIDEIKHLQTYKLSAEDEQVLVDRDDVVKIFADHVRATIEPERKKGKWIDRGKDKMLRWQCPDCGRKDMHIYNFCPDCGLDMGETWEKTHEQVEV